jgi:glutathione S-transferase
MKLYSSPASPFVRKVLVAAIELGLRDRIELVEAKLTPVSPDPHLSKHNPLGKIPALVTNDGQTIVDSRVIVDYLDDLAGGSRLAPSHGAARTRILRVEALADGLIDAGILIRYETVLRPEPLRWSEWIAGQSAKVTQTLAVLDAEVNDWAALSTSVESVLDIGTIAAFCAIGWLEFRKPVEGLREQFPALFAAYDQLAERPSFRATVPS